MFSRTCLSRRTATLIGLGLIAASACGDSAPTEPAELSAKDIVVPAADVAGVVKSLYDVLAAGQRADSAIAEILTPLMFIQRVGVEDVLTRELAQAGQPVVTDVQIGALADAYAAERRHPLNSFFVGVSQGFGATTPSGAPITRAYLTEQLASLVGKTEYTGEEIVPALVLAIGKERASRSAAGVTDAVWGDEWLDPLQLTLLMYGVYFSGGDDEGALRGLRGSNASFVSAMSSVGSGTANAVGKWYGKLGGWLLKQGKEWAKDQRADLPKGYMEGKFEGIFKIPITTDEAPLAAICASLLMYSYKFEMDVDPTLIYHRREDDPALPSQSIIDALLRFDLHPGLNGLFAEIGCGEMPAPGPAPGKPIVWVITEQLPEHGDLSNSDLQTNVDGRARAIYQAVDEIVPPALRMVQKDAGGTINATASNLVPEWSGLESMVGVGFYNPTEEGVRIFVRYFDLPPSLVLRVDSRFTRTSEPAPGFRSFEAVQVIGDIPLTLSGTRYMGEGTLPFGGAGFQYEPVAVPCYSFTMSTPPGPARASAVVTPGKTLGEFTVALGMVQAGTTGAGLLTPLPSPCPPGQPVPVPLPNPFFGFFQTFHPASITGWQSTGGFQPFATYSTSTTRNDFGVELTEVTTLGLHIPPP